MGLLVVPFSTMLTFYKDSFITYSGPGSLKNCQNFLKNQEIWFVICVHTQGSDPSSPLVQPSMQRPDPPSPLSCVRTMYTFPQHNTEICCLLYSRKERQRLFNHRNISSIERHILMRDDRYEFWIFCNLQTKIQKILIQLILHRWNGQPFKIWS